jgi:signal transduction histidine kinase
MDEMKAMGFDLISLQNPDDPVSPPKILITEDEYIVAFDLQVRLRNLGYDVVGLASSCDDALIQVHDHKPDVVLMDILLHGEVDGIETARQIREMYGTPVIFITANADDSTLQRAGAIGPHNCLLKPFKERELKFSIDMALHHSRTNRLLAAAREELEKRVITRTAELEASNQALQLELEKHQRTLADLREAQMLARSADHAKNEFLATISHELLTPMNGIVGMVELLIEGAASPLQREQLGVVQGSAETLLSIINDLLDFSRIENGTMEFTATPFNLREQMGAFLRPFAVRAGARGIGFSWELEPTIPEVVIGDHTRIGQVLANLTSNAIKFTEHGDVKVLIEQKAQEENRILFSFSVHDTGIGIPEDKQKVIFEPFVQADSSLSRRYGGAGLGLSIASRIASMMGGKIHVSSKPKEGSTFCFELWLGRVRKPA